MKLTPIDAVLIVNAVTSLQPPDAAVPGRLALRKARITVPLEPHVKPFFEGREALLKSLGGSADPNNPEQWAAFVEGVAELEADMSAEPFEVELAPLPAAVVDSIENINEQAFNLLVSKGLIDLD